MAATKKETVLDFLNNAYNEYHIDYRENSIEHLYFWNVLKEDNYE